MAGGGDPDEIQVRDATTIGVLANVGSRGNRAILGFIAYGYSAALLRLDRIAEYLLFGYAHRYHDHSPGSWTAGEVAGLGGGEPTFCIPAQLTIPCVVRWMLAIEDQDEDRLYLAKGLPAPGSLRASQQAWRGRPHAGGG